ncbi:YciI family protein [Sulfitobacter mediterraneus]|uniref:YciI family protein n=1 Tax=Sulfitobacter mediterraneus TaxID=83219 RepID=UPI0021A64621|nr:YciI family protein [Sulfitobacter mediterraneus]UWR10332.1 YciI family protein [Sulfitobacter mediterraneus]
MPNTRSVFIVDLHYIVPLSNVDAHVPGHVEFLNRSYDAGLFLMSGAKVPRTGGMIVAISESRAALDEHLAKDPFHAKNIAEYTITEFQAKMHKTGIFD